MIMEQWFVCLILPAVTWLLYMGYRLRQGKGRSGEKNTEHGPEEAVIEGIAACGTTLPEVFSGFQEERFLNQLESMDMENKDLLKEMEEKSVYAETFLDRRITGKRKQTYIHSSLYEELAGILPVIAPGLSVPMFVNNVLADHLEKHRDVMNEMYRKEVEKRLQEWKK